MNWIRYCSLKVGNEQLDLSSLRVRFYLQQSKIGTPNHPGEIRVYNLAKSTVTKLVGTDPFKTGGGVEGQELTLDVGYRDNHAVIYKANTIKCQAGRENPLDTFVDFYCREGDSAHNHGIINKNFAPGSKQEDHVKEILNVYKPFGVTMGKIKGLSDKPYPRSVSLYGMARDVMRQYANENKATWYFYNQKLNHVPLDDKGDGGAIKIDPTTGMVGMPVAIDKGVNVTCLINPAIQVGGIIQLDTSDINPMPWVANFDADFTAGKAGIAGAFDGTYTVQSIETRGDSRGAEWYMNITAFGTAHGPGLGTQDVIGRTGAGGG